MNALNLLAACHWLAVRPWSSQFIRMRLCFSISDKMGWARQQNEKGMESCNGLGSLFTSLCLRHHDFSVKLGCFQSQPLRTGASRSLAWRLSHGWRDIATHFLPLHVHPATSLAFAPSSCHLCAMAGNSYYITCRCGKPWDLLLSGQAANWGQGTLVPHDRR